MEPSQLLRIVRDCLITQHFANELAPNADIVDRIGDIEIDPSDNQTLYVSIDFRQDFAIRVDEF